MQTIAILLVTTLAVASPDDVLRMTRCPAGWTTVRSVLENVTETPLNCRFDRLCMGISCNGTGPQHGGAVSVGIHVKPCDNPVAVVVRANVPRLGVVDWTRTFTAEDRAGTYYPVAGARVRLGNDSVLEGMLRVDLEQQRDRNIMLDVALKGRLMGTSVWPVYLPLLVDQRVAVPPCDERDRPRPETYVASGREPHRVGDVAVKTLSPSPRTDRPPCDLTLADNGCAPGEVCVQKADGSPRGACECLRGRDADGDCAPEPTSVTTFADSTARDGPAPRSTAASASPSLAVQVAVPLAVLVACSLLVYVGARMRVFRRLRAQILRVSGHEELIADGEEDDDHDHDPRAPAIA